MRRYSSPKRSTVLGTQGEVSLNRAYERDAFDRVWEGLKDKKRLGHIYTAKSVQYERVLDTLNEEDTREAFYNQWRRGGATVRQGGRWHS